jgi:inhibitor of cysteine peptidase
MQFIQAYKWKVAIKERKVNMFKKITFTLPTIILILSMAGCSTGSTLTQSSSTSNSGMQEIPAGTSTETTPANNQQLLPIISENDASLTLNASADGTTQQLKVNEVMAITLESNPSTGYGWFATSSNPDVVAQTGDTQSQAPQSSSGTPIMGAAGTETLSFQAISAGTATLILDYKRGWETNVVPEKTITITVEVK